MIICSLMSMAWENRFLIYVHFFMKLTFVTSTLTSGGAERVISLLANEFYRKGNEVEMICLTNLKADYYQVDDGVKLIHAEDVAGHSLLKRLIWFRKHIKQEKPDCVIAFMEAVYEFVLMALLGMKVSRGQKRQAVPVISSERKDPKTLGPLRKFLRWILLPTATAHVVQTQAIKNFYNAIVRKKTYIIYNPVNERVYDMPEVEREDRIISVGRLYPQKNQQMLIRAFNQVKDKYPSYKLVIYGEGYLRPDLEKLIIELNLQGRVELPGTTTRILDEVKRSKVFCLSSNFEGMSNAMIEAMCLGTPVISTKVSGTDELIRNGENGLLVDLGDVDGLAKAFDRLLGDENLQRTFAERCLKMSSVFQIDSIVGKWEQLIQQVQK